MPDFIAALDQGTTSTRCLIFNRKGKIIASARKEHRQIYPQPGWVEHDPLEIWENSQEVLAKSLEENNLTTADLAALGITNQRETTVVWNRETGEPVHQAIVWQDTRTDAICDQLAKEGGQDRFRKTTGLPLSTYFSGPKIKWILDHVKGARRQADQGQLLFGTMDSWLAWNLTGGTEGGLHLTDVTNASRTQLMDLESLNWDQSLLETLEIPAAMLPEIVPSSQAYGEAAEPFSGLSLAGILGDQQAALFGQTCYRPGQAKNTYGTGCFLLMNTGESPTHSNHGLLTTLGYQIGEQPPVYALEGSIAIAGALVQWLRDNLGLINSAEEIETLAGQVEDSGGIYFVPAFSGLYAPYWKSDARGVIVGLTRYINQAHLARAVLEATAYQTAEILEAMEKESGVKLKSLRVDGGMVKNDLLMQFQSDVLGVPVIKPEITETTSLGAAYAAGLAVGYWKDTQELESHWAEDQTWHPEMEKAHRSELVQGWKKAVTRSFNWVE